MFLCLVCLVPPLFASEPSSLAEGRVVMLWHQFLHQLGARISMALGWLLAGFTLDIAQP